MILSFWVGKIAKPSNQTGTLNHHLQFLEVIRRSVTLKGFPEQIFAAGRHFVSHPSSVPLKNIWKKISVYSGKFQDEK